MPSKLLPISKEEGKGIYMWSDSMKVLPKISCGDENIEDKEGRGRAWSLVLSSSKCERNVSDTCCQYCNSFSIFTKYWISRKTQKHGSLMKSMSIKNLGDLKWWVPQRLWWQFGGLQSVLSITVFENKSETYCNQLVEMHAFLQNRRPALVNWHGPILFYDKAQPLIAILTLQKLIDLG